MQEAQLCARCRPSKWLLDSKDHLGYADTGEGRTLMTSEPVDSPLETKSDMCEEDHARFGGRKNGQH